MISKPKGALLIRPTPVTGESFPGFLLRVVERNAYSSISELLVLCWGRTPVAPERFRLQLSCGLSDLSPLATRLSLPTEAIAGLNFPLIQLENHPSNTALRYHTLKIRRVCPECLRESKIHRAVWCLAQYIACAKHCCFLITHCSACKQVIDWQGNRLTKCGCGQDLVSENTKRATNHISQYMWELERHYSSISTAPKIPASYSGEKKGLSAHQLNSLTLMRLTLDDLNYFLNIVDSPSEINPNKFNNLFIRHNIEKLSQLIEGALILKSSPVSVYLGVIKTYLEAQKLRYPSLSTSSHLLRFVGGHNPKHCSGLAEVLDEIVPNLSSDTFTQHFSDMVFSVRQLQFILNVSSEHVALLLKNGFLVKRNDSGWLQTYDPKDVGSIWKARA